MSVSQLASDNMALLGFVVTFVMYLQWTVCSELDAAVFVVDRSMSSVWAVFFTNTIYVIFFLYISF